MKNKKNFFFLSILSMLIVLVPLLSTTNCVQASAITTTQQSIIFMNNVSGLNTTAYNSTIKTSHDYFLTLPKEVNDFRFTTSDGSCRAMLTFVNNRLQQMFMSNYSGQFKLSQFSSNTLESAKEFMVKYQNYQIDFDCSTMISLLNSLQCTSNSTKVSGNTMFTVTTVDSVCSEYAWTYVDQNGVPALLKSVILTYQNGLLQCFQNNWQFYSVASKPLISHDAAVKIAIQSINNYSTTVLMPDNTTKPVSGF